MICLMQPAGIHSVCEAVLKFCSLQTIKKDLHNHRIELGGNRNHRILAS